MIFVEHKLFSYEFEDVKWPQKTWTSVFKFHELDRTEYLHPNYIYFKGKGFKDFYTQISVFISKTSGKDEKNDLIYYGQIDETLPEKDEYTLSELTHNKLHFAMTHNRLVVQLDRKFPNFGEMKTIKDFEITYRTYTFSDETRDDLCENEYYPNYKVSCLNISDRHTFFNFNLPPSSMFDIPEGDFDIYINGVKKDDLDSQYHNKSIYTKDITILNKNKAFNLFTYHHL